jgi:hypothetical protein
MYLFISFSSAIIVHALNSFAMRKSSFLFSSKEEDDAEVFTEPNEQIGAINTDVISESFPMTGNDAITDQHMEEPEAFTATFDQVEHNLEKSNDVCDNP